METNNTTLNVATAFSSYVVKALGEFKGVSLEEGQYLCRKIEKGTGLESKGVVLPATSAEDLILALDSAVVLDAAVAWYQEVIADVVKAKIAVGATTIVASDYNLEVVVDHLQAKEVSEGRVSKEKIAAWFDVSVASTLKVAFREKLGESLTDEKLSGILAAYKGVFQLLAKRDLVLDTTKKANLGKALDLLPPSVMKSYCEKKLAEESQNAADIMECL
jgi:hypothetical protein